MVCTPVPETRDGNRRVTEFLLFTIAKLNGRSLGRIRSELGKAIRFVKVRHVTRHEEEVNHVQSSRIVLFTRVRTFTAPIRLGAALLFNKDLIYSGQISLCFFSIERRHCKAETAGERRGNEVADITFVSFISVLAVNPLIT